MSNKTNDLYEFGDFKIDLNQEVLYRGEKLIQLAPKVFDTLLMLVENNGKILSKDEMMESVWKNSFVEEGNLTQNIYTLRQIFGKRNQFIKTIPKRGYRFEADVKIIPNGNGLVSLHENGNVEMVSRDDFSEVVVARRTKTTVIDEEIVENDKDSKVKLLQEANNKKPFVRSKRFRMGVGIGAVIALLIGVVGFFVWQRNFAQPAASPLDKITVENLTDSGDVADFAISPDGLFLALVKRDPERAFSIWLKDTESKEELPINIAAEFRPRAVNFSPNGKTIYFLNRRENVSGAEIYKTGRFGGKADYVAGDVWSEFSVSSSGKKIAFFRKKLTQNRFQLVVWDIEKKSEKIVLTKEVPDGFARRTSPAWSPDEKEIYAVSSLLAKPVSKLVKIEIESGEESIVKTPGIRQFTSVLAMPNGEQLIFEAREKNRFPQIYKINKTGGKFTRLTNDLNYYRRLALSSDGRNLVAMQKRNFSHI